MKIGVFAFVFFLTLSSRLSAQNLIINGGFEDINSPLVIGWESIGNPPQIYHTFSTGQHGSTVDVNVTPFEGDYFVVLNTGGGSQETSYSQLTQAVSVAGGEFISGAFYFSSSDWVPPWNDTGTITLVPTDPCSGLSSILLAKKDVAAVGSYGAMAGWETFSHSFDSDEAGNYMLVLRVQDAVDFAYSSYLAVDALYLDIAPGCHYNLLGDLNDDCKVDFFDFNLLANEWLNACEAPIWCNRTDLNRSNFVDFGDLELMAINWLIDCSVQPPNRACVPK
jgi:hypothetical protein